MPETQASSSLPAAAHQALPAAGALLAQHALLPDGWAAQVLVTWDDQGVLTSVRPNATPEAASALHATQVCWLLPGMPNAHSHAFQRVFAGLTEARSSAAGTSQHAPTSDSFWSWRERMYQMALRLSPEDLQAIALWLYVEMLEAGYTAVCEFHYLHHQEDGAPYAPPWAMAAALLDAAQQAGLSMTLLPVAYQNSGFGGQAPQNQQRRFILATDAMLQYLQGVQPLCQHSQARLGLAPHSLRAITAAPLQTLVSALHSLDAQAPIHIHIAEQQAEVQACLAQTSQRPVAWLLDHVAVDARWCLVHATHMTAAESAAAAQSGAVVALCPSTEANLGDGIFDWPAWQKPHLPQAQGTNSAYSENAAYAIGSDSHVCVNVAEELMLLEYSQRLALQQRNVCASDRFADTATRLYLGAVQGGAQACGALHGDPRTVAGLAVGQAADMVSLDSQHLSFVGLSDPSHIMASHVFASSRSGAIDSVWVAGQRLVSKGRHPLHTKALAAFARVRQRLLA